MEFDATGRFEVLTIDFEAMAVHIKSLHIEALKRGIEIWRVIFHPRLQPLLYRTEAETYLKEHIQIFTKTSWVRHDDHNHGDFEVKCQPL